MQNSSPISALLRWRHFRLSLSLFCLSLSLSLSIYLSHRAHLTHNIGSTSALPTIRQRQFPRNVTTFKEVVANWCSIRGFNTYIWLGKKPINTLMLSQSIWLTNKLFFLRTWRWIVVWFKPAANIIKWPFCTPPTPENPSTERLQVEPHLDVPSRSWSQRDRSSPLGWPAGDNGWQCRHWPLDPYPLYIITQSKQHLRVWYTERPKSV